MGASLGSCGQKGRQERRPDPGCLGRGPWELKPEADGELCVYSGSYFDVDDDLTEVQRRRVRRLVYEGMSERLRTLAQVPVRGVQHMSRTLTAAR